jgi:hypothetical protein
MGRCDCVERRRGRGGLCLATFAASLLAMGVAPWPHGCALEGTGGRVALVELRATSAAESDAELGRLHTRFDPSWTVDLEIATVVIGAVWAYPPPPTASWVPFGPAVARAHAGDDNLAGALARVEWREQFVVDALDPASRVIGTMVGEAGAVERGSVFLDAPLGQLRTPDGPTRGHHAFVRGVARRGEREVRFEAGLGIEDRVLLQRVDEVPVGGSGRVEEGSVLTVRARPANWLRDVDFDAIAGALDEGDLSTDDDGWFRPRAESQFRNAFYVGVHSADAWQLVTEESE